MMSTWKLICRAALGNRSINFLFALKLYTDENLTSPPTRDILLETARTRNSMQLPIPKPTCGLQLPPDRFCITATNYHPAKSAQKNKMAASTSFSNQVSLKLLKLFLILCLSPALKTFSYLSGVLRIGGVFF